MARPWGNAKRNPKTKYTRKKDDDCVWWDSKGLMYFEVLNSGETVTADFYKKKLTHVNQALRHQGVNSATIKFLQFYAQPNVAKITQQKIEELGGKPYLTCRIARIFLHLTTIYSGP